MVAMYSIRSITKGEELTFDYNAVTASKREFSLAACLCGSVNCRGSFLYLTKTKMMNNAIKYEESWAKGSILQKSFKPAPKEVEENA